MWVDIRDSVLSIDEVTAKVMKPSSGGIDVFVGVVQADLTFTLAHDGWLGW